MKLTSYNGLAAAAFVVALSTAAPVTAQDLCGRPTAPPSKLFAIFTKQKFPVLNRDQQFVAFEDRAKSTVWTFTAAGHAAHPSAVCRRMLEQGGQIQLEMKIRCDAPEPACKQLLAEFQALNARMIEEMKRKKR